MNELNNLTPPQKEEVRKQVRSLLDKTDSFKKMSPAEQQKLAHGLVTVVGFLADPGAGQKKLARAQQQKQQSATEKLQDRLASKQNLVGKDFKAAGVEAGVQGYTDAVKAVDFPKFVSGLIEGVFTSIVDSSIRQMQAYGKLLEGVVKSVDQFANDHITPNQARDYLRNKYPEALKIDTSDGSPRLALNDDLDDSRMPNFKQDLGLDNAPDLDDGESEQAIVHAAQLQMAKMRQQQLSTMVLLGINRIVVTDGLINAKVVIDMKASDTARRNNSASSFDQQNDSSRSSSGGGGWFSDDWSNESSSNHVITVSSATSDTSESKAEIKSKLTGEVRVNFKSETFPLEKMASQTEIGTLGERASRG